MHDIQVAELLESIDRHFKSGCGFIDATQLNHHKRSGICPECAARRLITAGVRVKVTSDA